MKVKNSFWALAFALMAVSCSDDIEGGPNGNNGNGEAAETAKVNVMISTETGTATKAAGEDGDDNEIGSEDEYAVKDVTLILFALNDGADASAKLTDLKSTYKLVAAGWTDKIGQMSPGDATTGTGNPGFPNSRMTTVEIQVKSGESLLATTDAKEYGVLAVTNLGETEGERLVAKVGAADGYSTVADLDKQVYQDKTNNNFVMSTHTLSGKINNVAVNSTVKFTSDASVVPSTTVFVERLSAKIRITANGGNTPTFTYKVEASSTTDSERDEVVLTDVAIVNQLDSKSYLLKRVSAVLGSTDTDLGSTTTTDVLLGDELADNSSPAKGTNFVIDPWTRNKIKDNVSTSNSVAGAGELSSSTLNYINRWKSSTFGGLWESYNNAKNTIALNTDNLTSGKLDLCYTQENTTSIVGSLKGYNTGALFKATYYPYKLSEWDEASKSVAAKDVTYTTGDGGAKTPQTFYTFNNIKFKDYQAILAYIIEKAGITGVNYGTFSNVQDQNFKDNILKLKGVDDPFGYIEAMVTEAEKTAGATYKTPTEYLNEFNPTSLSDDMKKAFNQNVQKYTDSVCYYEYWIHHSNNGNNVVTSPMDVAIVRNNIYDLTVTKINNLGSSEVDPTDPTEPSEDTGLKIQVALYVKNWVVRNNGDIHF